jgi:hypothetical protein
MSAKIPRFPACFLLVLPLAIPQAHTVPGLFPAVSLQLCLFSFVFTGPVLSHLLYDSSLFLDPGFLASKTNTLFSILKLFNPDFLRLYPVLVG